MKNCLYMSIKFKLRHKKAIIKYVPPGIFSVDFLQMGVVIEYFKYLSLNGVLLTLFLPHFYILYENIKYEFVGEKITRTRTIS